MNEILWIIVIVVLVLVAILYARSHTTGGWEIVTEFELPDRFLSDVNNSEDAQLVPTLRELLTNDKIPYYIRKSSARTQAAQQLKADEKGRIFQETWTMVTIDNKTSKMVKIIISRFGINEGYGTDDRVEVHAVPPGFGNKHDGFSGNFLELVKLLETKGYQLMKLP